ncbi:class A beta-lactamase [Fundidesulfovibrio terrae]|uniref:class A beta-lactamase n=1 Tax=Fundidesulfovibrio terrae TaxID=2922866 RepID=UPI001FAE9DE8|nr:class A beta-lactamase [Fundidesulfovibrio terrae]
MSGRLPRTFASFLLLALMLIAGAGASRAQQPASPLQKIAELERQHGGRLGVAMLDTRDGSLVSYRGGERFPFCSTFKIILVAKILHQSVEDPKLLDKRFRITGLDIEKYAPIVSKQIGEEMTVSDLCGAAIMYSDNAATNILMRHFGGPEAVTAFARGLGDDAFRLDRREPELNTAITGDPRDTSTPDSMANAIRSLFFGNVLPKIQQDILMHWLLNNTTGNQRIRAGIPSGWVVGDKTGTGDYGTTNDVAVFWPDGGGAVILAVYYTQDGKDAKAKNEIIASAARILTHRD